MKPAAALDVHKISESDEEISSLPSRTSSSIAIKAMLIIIAFKSVNDWMKMQDSLFLKLLFACNSLA